MTIVVNRREVERALNRTVGRVVGEIATDLVSELKRESPVVTGFFRASWIPRVGGRATGNASKAATSPGAQSQLSFAGVRRLLSYTLRQGLIEVSNNAIYARILTSIHYPSLIINATRRTVAKFTGRRVRIRL